MTADGPAAAESPSGSESSSHSTGLTPWRTHAAFILACIVTCLAWSWYAGRDLNWDQLNYHFYSAYHFLGGRLDRDFMAASVQGYLNPLAYVPFYLMVNAGWHSLLIGSTLALLHSACLSLVYGISRELIPAGTPFRAPLIGSAVALALLAPVFLVEVGNTFIDVTTTIPVLAAVLLLLVAHRSGNTRLLTAIAGVLLGAAAGLKPTNAMFALAACALIVVSSHPLENRIRDMAGYALGGVAGVLLVEGVWAYRLFETFGNPFFPWFNARFKSPDFPAFNLSQVRFLPSSLGDYLRFPIDMLDFHRNIYTETQSPDARFAILFALLPLAGWALLRRSAVETRTSPGGPAVADTRMFLAAVVFTLASYVLWLVSSGNGRYAIALQLFLGPMIVATALALTHSKRTLALLLGSVLLVQTAIVWLGADRRWQRVGWTASWYNVDIPAPLRQRGFLYLSLDAQPVGFLAPFLDSSSSFVNLVGQSSLALERPGGERLHGLLERHRSSTRTLILVRAQNDDGTPHAVIFAVQDSILERIGLRSDPGDCLTIVMHDVVEGRVLIPAGSTFPKPFTPDDTQFLTCATVAREATADSALVAARARVDRAFDILERSCRRLFSPPGPYTDHLNTTFSRTYVNTDARLRETDGMIRFAGWKPGPPVPIGKIEDILSERAIPDCASLMRFQFGPGR